MRYQVERQSGRDAYSTYEIIDTAAKPGSRERIMCIAHKPEADRIASALNNGVKDEHAHD